MLSLSRPLLEHLATTPKRNSRSKGSSTMTTTTTTTTTPVAMMRKNNSNAHILDKTSRITTIRNIVRCFCLPVFLCSYLVMMLQLHRLAQLHLRTKGVLPLSLPSSSLETNVPEAIRPASGSGQESAVNAPDPTLNMEAIGKQQQEQPQQPSLALNSISNSVTASSPKAAMALYGGGWDGAPIVVEEYKLVFYTQPKVASTTLKQLFRRMMHLKDWSVHKEPFLPHDPNQNGLRYLYHYPPSRVAAMMTSPRWTRAIFVRDPKERFLSAYLDKAVRKNGTYVQKHCCNGHWNARKNLTTSSCSDWSPRSFLGFLEVIDHQDGGCCCDPHWKRQSSRVMPSEHWKYINFVGHFETLAMDTKRLLLQLNNNREDEEGHDVEFDDQAWCTYGASGWGIHGNQSIFSENTGVKHETKAYGKLQRYYTSSLVERLVEDFYQEDYDHALLNFSRDQIVVTGNDNERGEQRPQEVS